MRLALVTGMSFPPDFSSTTCGFKTRVGKKKNHHQELEMSLEYGHRAKQGQETLISREPDCAVPHTNILVKGVQLAHTTSQTGRVPWGALQSSAPYSASKLTNHPCFLQSPEGRCYNAITAFHYKRNWRSQRAKIRTKWSARIRRTSLWRKGNVKE